LHKNVNVTELKIHFIIMLDMTLTVMGPIKQLLYQCQSHVLWDLWMILY